MLSRVLVCALSGLVATLVSGCSAKEDGGADASAGEGGSTGGAAATTFSTAPDDGGNGNGDGMEGPGDGEGDGVDDPGDTAGEGDDGLSFVLPPDGGGASECDPKLQDCDRGEKCTAWANDGGTFWNANRCVEITGTGVAGDVCMVEGNGVSGLDDCDIGHICMNSDEMGVGVCIEFCAGDDEDCEPGNVCAIYNDGVLPICLLGCDPLLQDCGEMQSCIDTPNQTFICFSDASGAGGAEGDPCPSEHGENSCDPGMWCGTGIFGCDQAKCCIPYCDLGDPVCTSPNECTSFFGDPDAAPPGLGDVGVCVVP